MSASDARSAFVCGSKDAGEEEKDLSSVSMSAGEEDDETASLITALARCARLTHSEVSSRRDTRDEEALGCGEEEEEFMGCKGLLMHRTWSGDAGDG